MKRDISQDIANKYVKSMIIDGVEVFDECAIAAKFNFFWLALLIISKYTFHLLNSHLCRILIKTC